MLCFKPVDPAIAEFIAAKTYKQWPTQFASAYIFFQNSNIQETS